MVVNTAAESGLHLGKALEYVVELSVKCGELLLGTEAVSERNSRCRKDFRHRKFGAAAKVSDTARSKENLP